MQNSPRNKMAMTVEQLAELTDFQLLLLQADFAIAVGMADQRYWRHEIVTEGPRSYSREICTDRLAHDKLMAPYKAFLERAAQSRQVRQEQIEKAAADEAAKSSIIEAPPDAEIIW